MGLNRRGILEKNTVGLILAAIGIIVVIVIIYKLYSYALLDNEVKSAAKVLDSILAKVDRIDGRGKVTVVGVPAIAGGGADAKWFLTGWSKGEKGRPDKCFFGGSCICVCKIEDPFKKMGEVYIRDLSSLSKEEADKRLVEYKQKNAQTICQNPKTGVCRTLDYSTLAMQYPILTRRDNPGAVFNPSRFYDLVFSDAPFIPLPPLLIELDIQESSNKQSLVLRSFSEDVKAELLKKP